MFAAVCGLSGSHYSSRIEAETKLAAVPHLPDEDELEEVPIAEALDDVLATRFVKHRDGDR